jgi:transposase InsO family protein
MVTAGRGLGDRFHPAGGPGDERAGNGHRLPRPRSRGIIHGDHGTQFTSWTFTERARQAGLLPSLGTIGDPYDNAVIESFWGRMQTELLNRQRWDTRVELANAIFEYIEGFHNRRRRHSALHWQTPIEFETTAINRAPAPQIAVQETGS